MKQYTIKITNKKGQFKGLMFSVTLYAANMQLARKQAKRMWPVDEYTILNIA